MSDFSPETDQYFALLEHRKTLSAHLETATDFSRDLFERSLVAADVKLVELQASDAVQADMHSLAAPILRARQEFASLAPAAQ